MHRKLGLVCFVALVFAGGRHSRASLQAVKIAGAGQAAPGVPGAVFERFDQTPTIDQNGVITFRAFLHHAGAVSDGNDEGIWSGTPGNFSLIARENGVVPSGTPGAGEGARFGANLSISNVSGHGFSFASGGVAGAQYIVTSSGLSLVAHNGMNMGGDSANPLLFRGLSGPVLALNPSGQYAFGGELEVGSGGVTDTTKSGMWANLDGTLKLIARQGSQVDGMPAGITWSGLFFYPEISDSGEVFFKGVLSDGRFGIFSFDGVSTHALAINTDQVPGAPAGATFGLQPVNQPRVNSRGDLVIVGSSKTWLKDASGYKALPPAGGFVSRPADVTDDGVVIYRTSGGELNRWLPNGTIQRVAISSQFGTLFAPTISSTGFIAFDAMDMSLYVAEPGGTPVGVAGPIGGGFIASRQFTDVEYNQWSASGDLVFTSGDNTPHDIWFVHAPEPTAGLFLAAGAVILSARRRARVGSHGRRCPCHLSA